MRIQAIYYYAPSNDKRRPPILSEDYPVVYQKLLSNYRGGLLTKRLSGSKGHVISVRADDKTRLLFKHAVIANEEALIFLEVLENHQYERAYFLSKDGANLLKDITTLPIKKDFAPSLVTPSSQPRLDEDLKIDTLYSYNSLYIHLNEEQEALLQITLPMVIHGSPGTGKSCLLKVMLEKIVQTLKDDERALYVAKEKKLVDAMRQNFEGTIGYEKIDFLSWKEFLAYQGFDTSKEKYADFSTFSSWFEKQKTPKEKSFHWYYRNCLLAYAYGEKKFLNLPSKKIEVPASERQTIIDLLKKYQTYLSKKALHAPLQESFMLSIPDAASRKTWKVVAGDERQDLQGNATKLLVKSAEEDQVLFAGDPWQCVYGFDANIDYLNSLLGNRLTTKQLYKGMRCRPHITQLLNHLISMITHAFGGTEKKALFSKIQESNFNEHGSVRFLDDATQGIEVFKKDFSQSMAKDFGFVILTQEALLEEAKIHFQTARVFTPESYKGLEAEVVLIYKLLDVTQKSKNEKLTLKALNDAFQSPINFQEKKGGNLPKNAHQSLDTSHLKTLYTAISRTIFDVIIYENKTHEIEHILETLKQKNPNVEPDTMLAPAICYEIQDRTPKEWQEHVILLLQNDLLMEAQASHEAHCTGHPDILSFDTLKSQYFTNIQKKSHTPSMHNNNNADYNPIIVSNSAKKRKKRKKKKRPSPPTPLSSTKQPENLIHTPEEVCELTIPAYPLNFEDAFLQLFTQNNSSPTTKIVNKVCEDTYLFAKKIADNTHPSITLTPQMIRTEKYGIPFGLYLFWATLLKNDGTLLETIFSCGQEQILFEWIVACAYQKNLYKNFKHLPCSFMYYFLQIPENLLLACLQYLKKEAPFAFDFLYDGLFGNQHFLYITLISSEKALTLLEESSDFKTRIQEIPAILMFPPKPEQNKDTLNINPIQKNTATLFQRTFPSMLEKPMFFKIIHWWLEHNFSKTHPKTFHISDIAFAIENNAISKKLLTHDNGILLLALLSKLECLPQLINQKILTLLKEEFLQSPMFFEKFSEIFQKTAGDAIRTLQKIRTLLEALNEQKVMSLTLDIKCCINFFYVIEHLLNSVAPNEKNFSMHFKMYHNYFSWDEKYFKEKDDTREMILENIATQIENNTTTDHGWNKALLDKSFAKNLLEKLSPPRKIYLITHADLSITEKIQELLTLPKNVATPIIENKKSLFDASFKKLAKNISAENANPKHLNQLLAILLRQPWVLSNQTDARHEFCTIVFQHIYRENFLTSILKQNHSFSWLLTLMINNPIFLITIILGREDIEWQDLLKTHLETYPIHQESIENLLPFCFFLNALPNDRLKALGNLVVEWLLTQHGIMPLNDKQCNILSTPEFYTALNTDIDTINEKLINMIDHDLQSHESAKSLQTIKTIMQKISSESSEHSQGFIPTIFSLFAWPIQITHTLNSLKKSNKPETENCIKNFKFKQKLPSLPTHLFIDLTESITKIFQTFFDTTSIQIFIKTWDFSSQETAIVIPAAFSAFLTRQTKSSAEELIKFFSTILETRERLQYFLATLRNTPNHHLDLSFLKLESEGKHKHKLTFSWRTLFKEGLDGFFILAELFSRHNDFILPERKNNAMKQKLKKLLRANGDTNLEIFISEIKHCIYIDKTKENRNHYDRENKRIRKYFDFLFMHYDINNGEILILIVNALLIVYEGNILPPFLNHVDLKFLPVLFRTYLEKGEQLKMLHLSPLTTNIKTHNGKDLVVFLIQNLMKNLNNNSLFILKKLLEYPQIQLKIAQNMNAIKPIKEELSNDQCHTLDKLFKACPENLPGGVIPSQTKIRLSQFFDSSRPFHSSLQQTKMRLENHNNQPSP